MAITPFCLYPGTKHFCQEKQLPITLPRPLPPASSPCNGYQSHSLTSQDQWGMSRETPKRCHVTQSGDRQTIWWDFLTVPHWWRGKTLLNMAAIRPTLCSLASPQFMLSIELVYCFSLPWRILHQVERIMYKVATNNWHSISWTIFRLFYRS